MLLVACQTLNILQDFFNFQYLDGILYNVIHKFFIKCAFFIEKPTEKYWEMVAVERKTALISALDENKDLHKHNSRLQEKVHKLEEKVDHLEEDNKKLEVLLSEAKALAELVEVRKQ